MSGQTLQPDQWIVADDGVIPAPLTMGQLHIRRERRETGGASLAMNILAAIPHVTGDYVVVMEDDDAYLPQHLETCVKRLENHKATGCVWLNYYNLRHRKWRRIRNSCAALCNTAFRRECLPMLADAAREAMALGMYHVDRLFWKRVGAEGLHEEETVIGLKGLAGIEGIGIGHRPGHGWRPDPAGKKLREWIGEAAGHYAIRR